MLFAFDLVHQATRSRLTTWRALYASLADLSWVIGTLVLLALYPGVLSASGTALVLFIALVVLMFGCWQLWAIGQAHRVPGLGRYRHCILVDTEVTADALWTVIGRIGDIQRFMPALRSSSMRDGKLPGVGAVRECTDRAGKHWAEECTDFKEGQSFEVRFLTEAVDFPFPATSMIGGWKVMPNRDQGSTVMVWWELEPKPRLLAPIILPILAFQADRDFPRIIGRMAAHAMGRESGDTARAKPVIRARLVTSLC